MEVGIGFGQHNQRQRPALGPKTSFPDEHAQCACSALAVLASRGKRSLLSPIGSCQLAWVSAMPCVPGHKEDWHTPVLIPTGLTTVPSSILN